jgi:hypothetical protein
MVAISGRVVLGNPIGKHESVMEVPTSSLCLLHFAEVLRLSIVNSGRDALDQKRRLAVY